MNAVDHYEQREIAKYTQDKPIPQFKSGDTVTVKVKIIEGEKERQQAFQGVVIARRNRGLGSTFRVRKMVGVEGIERSFHLYSPNIEISLERKGRVRRAKLYYLRGLSGKRARISEARK